MSDLSPRLALPFILPAQAQKHVTHNEALTRLDLLTQLTVMAFGATQPPSLPGEGEIWALGPGASGAWAGHDGDLAAWIGESWQFITPDPGWRAASGGDLRIWTGSAWTALTAANLENVPGLGVNTGFDATNRLSVSAPATLLSHEGADHQLKINKAAPGDTASLLFQSDWSGRAEMGLTGSDDFAIKVSADGTLWHDGLVVDAATGGVSLPNGLSVSGQITGDAVTQSPNDATPGRAILTDHGWTAGNLIGTVSQSGGIPTGAVIESGSNSNGEYVRFADGTQICTRSVDLDISSLSPSLTSFSTAASFVDGEATAGFAGGNATGDSFLNALARSIGVRFRFSQWQIHHTGQDTTSGLVPIKLLAIGRWF
jgi:hypothetical protein